MLLSPFSGPGRMCRLGIICGAVLALSGCLSVGDSGQDDDPVVVESAVAFIKRPLIFDSSSGLPQELDLADPSAFRPGARLYWKDSASPEAPERDISSQAFAGEEYLDDQGRLLYDVKDLHVSHDGTRLLFAMRAPEIEDADEDEQPTWNIWEYDSVTDTLRRVIESEITAEEGQDVAPAYLPDGRIVFSSTRQRQSGAVLLDEGRPQFAGLDEDLGGPAFVLHVMNPDGSEIQQITFNQSHDLDPVVAPDGTIIFSRWDNAGQTRNNGFNLYRVNPDGTGLDYLFGRHSHSALSGTVPLQYLSPRLTDQGDLLVQLRPFESRDYAAVPARVDVYGYVEAERTLSGGYGMGLEPLTAGSGFAGELSLRGSYGTLSPLLDGSNRYLASWSPCRVREVASGQIVNCTQERLQSPDYEPAPPVYGLWLFDPAQQSLKPVVAPEEGSLFDEAVLMRGRPLENHIPEAIYTDDARTLAEQGYGILYIRSVYDVDGADTTPEGIAVMADPLQTPAEERPARFLRLEKPVSIPDENVRDFDNSAYGRSRGQLMREILGYVPIEPDGSVKVAVPANVAFAVSIVDAGGQRTGPRHQNWLSVRPGETLACRGCHNPASTVPHGRRDAGPDSVWAGAPTTGQPFANTDPALYADMGETMAEVYARIRGIRRLSPDLVFEDEWTDPALAPKADPFVVSYADLLTPAPVSATCAADWAANCRSVIHYEQHIHPLWNLKRVTLDEDGVTVADDFTCTSCHSTTDEQGQARVPAAQLDLTDGPSADEPDHLRSYRELLYPDNEQELVNGALVDRLVDTGEILRDDEGNPILDENGNEQPIYATVPVQPSMSVNGAAASRFIQLFRPGGSHEGFLRPAELRLVTEWLDLGAQYYNDPFATPED